MQLVVGVAQDDFGPGDRSCERWSSVLRSRGHEVRRIDLTSCEDALRSLRGCHGFMWRYGHQSVDLVVATRLLPIAERELGILVYPDEKTRWHFDDKIAQHLLFRVHGVPSPETWIWFDEREALAWTANARYPLVAKLASGAGSSNVRIVRDPDAAQELVLLAFRSGLWSMDDLDDVWSRQPHPWMGLRGRFAALATSIARRIVRRPKVKLPPRWTLHRRYVIFQEFVPDNEFDTRITVIGDRAFGYRRFNRANDFRASGSGRIDPNPEPIDPAAVSFAFDAASKLEVQSGAFDIVYRESEPVILEVCYTFTSWMVHSCPGHWDRNLNWHPGAMWPEEAQAADFARRLESRWIENGV